MAREGRKRCHGLASSIPGLESNRIFVGHAPTTSFTSSEPTSNHTDPNRACRDHDGGMDAIDQGSIRRLIRSMPRWCRECIQAGVVIPATEQGVFILRVILNILNHIHDMVATVSTLLFGSTDAFPSCSFVMRITSAIRVSLWVHKYMLFHYTLLHKC